MTERESEEKTIGREEIYVGVVTSHHTVYIFLAFVFVFVPHPSQLGWSVGPAHLIKHLATVSSNSCYTIPTLLQVGIQGSNSQERVVTIKAVEQLK